MIDKLNALLEAIPESSNSWVLWTFLSIVAVFLMAGTVFSYFGREKSKRSEEAGWLTLIAFVILGGLAGLAITASIGTAGNNRSNVAAHLSTDPLIYELLADELSYDPAIMQVDLAVTSSYSGDSEQVTLFSKASSNSKDGDAAQSIKLTGARVELFGILPADPSVNRPTVESIQMFTWAQQLAANERPQVLVTYSNGQQAKLEATFDQSSKLVLVAPQGTNISTVRVPEDSR